MRAFFWLFFLISFPASGAEFYLVPDTKTLLMLGETKASDVQTMTTFIEENAISKLILQGPGGELDAGYAIADLVLKHELNTEVPAKTRCSSACSLIFSAGSIRKMGSGATLGFHLPFFVFREDSDVENYCKAVAPPQKSQARLWLHSPVAYTRCLTRTYQLGMKDLRRLQILLSRSNISEAVLDKVISTPSDQMTMINAGIARDLGLVND